MKTDDLISMLAGGAVAVPSNALQRRYSIALGVGAFGETLHGTILGLFQMNFNGRHVALLFLGLSHYTAERSREQGDLRVQRGRQDDDLAPRRRSPDRVRQGQGLSPGTLITGPRIFACPAASRGAACAAIFFFTKSEISSLSWSDGEKPERKLINAFTICPRIASGLPMTPASATAGC